MITIIFTVDELKSNHKFSFKNEESIRGSQLCGCFYCKEIFPATDVLSVDMITEKDGILTASCPICSIDAVLGDASVAISAKLFEAMNEYCFRTY